MLIIDLGLECKLFLNGPAGLVTAGDFIKLAQVNVIFSISYPLSAMARVPFSFSSFGKTFFDPGLSPLP